MKAVSKGEGLAVRAFDHLSAGDLDSAERDARAALELAPDSAVVNLNSGLVEEAAGRIASAEAAYRKALAIDPVQAEAAGNLSNILIRRGDLTQAIRILEPALQARPTYEPCWYNLVLAYVGSGQTDNAREAVRRARANGVELDPTMLRAFGLE
jgi:type IV pilus assembly protein PilF